MKSKLVSGPGAATYVAVLEPGDEALEELTRLVAKEGISTGQVTAVGAFERATVGWFDRAAKDYRPIEIGEQCEVLSLLGDIALTSGNPQLHLHAVLGLRDGTTRGGHLLEGHVWPTLEVIIREVSAELLKTYRAEIGLALIDIDRS